mmetsp:Transcript_31247/g.47893  ORF Transcript_31247/g.47893 Transcript_31247/m.47893 type:complete len:159 (-) Transcript_31247:511-987(-)|eukprot:CAMPEP_0195294636 /NCGR_PEP_ID=MMETSP0707-20130614/15589_1 /TAXON_ID=33640 /ORGANISM="Asterionellopsis glacialis, Strain CCMP134" /LENGTH=158 /DNA_ID=CAMNT_0040355669 /DNA_START=219 /DNA_END=695 /DNA_ORIENTATION=-
MGWCCFADPSRNRQQSPETTVALEGQRIQRELERSDNNVEPIHPHSNFIVEERRSSERAMTTEDVYKLIPRGVIIKPTGSEICAAKFAHSLVDLTENEDCVICLETWRHGDSVQISRYCSHIFHSDCIAAWLKESRECPSCRKLFMPPDLHIYDETRK